MHLLSRLGAFNSNLDHLLTCSPLSHSKLSGGRLEFDRFGKSVRFQHP